MLKNRMGRIAEFIFLFSICSFSSAVVDGLAFSIYDSIARKLDDETYMNKIENEVSMCMELVANVSLLHQKAIHREDLVEAAVSESDDPSTDISCKYVEYMYYLHQIRMFYGSHRKSGLQFERALRVDSIDSSTPYSSTFNQYVMKGRPFRGDLGEDSKNARFYTYSQNDWGKTLYNCSASGNNGIALRTCEGSFFDDILIPRYAAVNYLNRMVYPTLDKLDRRVGLDYKNDWPALFIVKSNRPPPVYQCPANMHLTIIGGPTEIVVRIFSVKSSAEHFAPYYNSSLPLHYPLFRLHGFSDKIPNADEKTQSLTHGDLPPFSEQRIGPGQFLFVPNRLFVSVLPYGEVERSAVPYLLQCSVDASNLNFFRDALSWYGTISRFDSELKRHISSSTFDHAVDKNAADIAFGLYKSEQYSDSSLSTQPKSTSSSLPTEGSLLLENRRDRKKKRHAGSADFKSWQDTTKWNMQIIALTLIPPAAVDIMHIGRTEVSLRWRSAFVPAISDRSVFGFIVTSCVISGRALRLRTAMIPFHSKDENLADFQCSTTLLNRGNGSDVLSEKVDQDTLLQTGEQVTLFQTTLRDLIPSTRYQLRINTLYDQSESPPSSWTIPFTTLQMTKPSVPLPVPHQLYMEAHDVIDEFRVDESSSTNEFAPLAVSKYSSGGVLGDFSPHIAIFFTAPLDDGGCSLQGYHVWARTVETTARSKRRVRSTISSEWIWIGAHQAHRAKDQENLHYLELLNLLPSVSYQFRIAAFNEIGNSSCTDATDSVLFDTEGLLLAAKRKRKIDLVHHHIYHARGHQKFYGPLTESFHASSESNFSRWIANEIGDEVRLVELDFRSEFMSLWSGKSYGSKFPFWKSHYTSSTLSVRGAIVFVDLNDAAVRNYSSSHSKIFVVERGVIPMAEKALRAQRAGAVALLVVDNQGCKSYQQSCLPGANRAAGEGFGAMDVAEIWNSVRIPVAFLLREYFDQAFPVTRIDFTFDSIHSEL